MARVWVQVWTAKVPGSVEVEESDLRKVEGLETLAKLIPMLVKASEHSGWEMVADWSRSPLVSVEEKVEVLESADLMELVLESEKVQESESERVMRRRWEIENCWRWVNRR